MKHEHAGRCAGIDRFVQGGEIDATGAQIIHHDQQLAQRAAKPVESPHDKGVAGLAFIEEALKSGALKASTGEAMVRNDGIAAIGLERQYLQVQILFVRRDSCVSDSHEIYRWDGPDFYLIRPFVIFLTFAFC